MIALEVLAAMPFDDRRREILLRGSENLRTDWPYWRQAGQDVPPGEWQTWLMMAGRGFGKTRAGSEWVRALGEHGNKNTVIALVAASMGEARDVMIEGESGILSVSPAATRPLWEPTRGRLAWRSGAQAFVFSGENPEKLRGPQHGFAWCDELAKWAYPRETWENLQLGLRNGARPRTLVTTTPRPVPLIRALAGHHAVMVTGGATRDNKYLPHAFIEGVTADYGGTRFGRQELDGELIDDVAGAMWTRAGIETCRVRATPGLKRVLIGVDPPASATGDACGIVCVGLGSDDVGYVIEDASVSGLSPEGWAGVVASVAARHSADRIIAEANNGGNMVESVLRAADSGLPVKLVHASRGKTARAEPVAALYGHGKMKHVGAFPALEDELCGLIQGGGYEGPGRSPDRADALVWAVTELMLGKRVAGPRCRLV